MQNTIVQMEDYRTHVVITTTNGVHVIPECLVVDWINGKAEPDKDCVKRIIQEWLNDLRRSRGDCEIVSLAEWNSGVPPHNEIVIVELDGKEIPAIAIHGGEGNLPHWKSPDDSKAWAQDKFKRWRHT